MKEITRIHLAATPYNIELAAKKELEKYLQSIEQTLTADDDTLREIEARMIELLAEKGVKSEKVITVGDVKMLKDRLGAPGEFADEPLQTGEAGQKRLMRDEQGGMAGGVLAGIAAYTNVDVAWYRIITIILAFASLGTALVVYLVLWLAIPPARTAAERLQMRGQRATLESIQEESATGLRDTPSHKKPLVIALRALGVLTLLGIMFGALAIVAAALFAGLPILSVSDWMANSWLVTALLVGSLSGLLLAVLMGVGVYMLMAWRTPKALVILSAVIVAAGLVSFGTSASMAIYGAQEMDAAIAKHTTTRREELPELRQVKSLKIAKTSTPVTYKVTQGEPYAEVETFQRDTTTRVPVELMREGDQATLRVGQLPQKECTNWIDHCMIEHASVTVYGPSIASLDVAESEVAYETDETQDLLKTDVKGSLRLAGRITTVEAVVKAGSLDASSAAIDTVKVSVDDHSTTELGVVRTLDVTAPVSCGADSRSEIDYERAADVRINGAPMATANTTCIELESGDEIVSPEA